MKFAIVHYSLDDGFAWGCTKEGLIFQVCLETGKKGKYIKQISLRDRENGSVWGLCGEANIPFFEEFPNSCNVAVRQLAKQLKFKLLTKRNS